MILTGRRINDGISEYGLRRVTGLPLALREGQYDAIILAVGHQQFRDFGIDRIKALGKPESVIFDVKYVLPRAEVDENPRDERKTTIIS